MRIRQLSYFHKAYLEPVWFNGVCCYVSYPILPHGGGTYVLPLYMLFNLRELKRTMQCAGKPFILSLLEKGNI